MFERWGRFVYRRRWAVLVASALLLALSIAGILTGGELAGNGGFGADLPAGKAAKLVQSEIHPQQEAKTGSQFSLVLSSSSLTADGPEFKAAVERALAPLSSDSRVTQVITPYTLPESQRAGLISKDQHRILAIVNVRDNSPQAKEYLPSILAEIHPEPLKMLATGQLPISLAFDTTLERDLQRAEVATLFITAPLLLLIFLSLVAMWMPLMVGGLAIAGGVAATLVLARFTDVSQYALNIVTLIGLALAIDYSLFVVNRFTDELAAGASREDAIARAMSTAGRLSSAGS